MRSYVSCPSASTRTTAWIVPDRSRMSRNAVLPWPRREIDAPGDLVAQIRVLACLQLRRVVRG